MSLTEPSLAFTDFLADPRSFLELGGCPLLVCLCSLIPSWRQDWFVWMWCVGPELPEWSSASCWMGSRSSYAFWLHKLTSEVWIFSERMSTQLSWGLEDNSQSDLSLLLFSGLLSHSYNIPEDGIILDVYLEATLHYFHHLKCFNDVCMT